MPRSIKMESPHPVAFKSIIWLLSCVLLSAETLQGQETGSGVHIAGNVIHIERGEVSDVALGGGNHPIILAGLSFDGIITLDKEGKILDSFHPADPLSELTGVAVSDPYGDRGIFLAAVVDWPKFRILLRGIDPETGRFLDPDLLAGDDNLSVLPRTTHVCFARDRYDDSLYLFAGGDHGRLYQFRVTPAPGGGIRVRELQQIVIGGPTTACASNDREGILYVTEPAMGVWRVITDAEEVPLREPLALVSPYGNLAEPVALTGSYRNGQFLALIVDDGIESILGVDSRGSILERRPFGDIFEAYPLNGSLAGIDSGRLSLEGREQAVIVAAITGEQGNSEIHLTATPWEATGAERPVPDNQDVVVRTLAVSAPVSGGMDAADDPAIWVHPDDPAKSLVLGADKGAGLGVYDLEGRLLQFLPDGRINNVDVHSGFTDQPDLSHIAVASDRTNVALAIYAIDKASGRVRRVDARSIPAELNDIYGLCLYRSPATGELYAFATSGDGTFNQWRLFPVNGKRVDAERVRQVVIGSMTESCVADDENGHLFVAEETVGIWRYGAEPSDGDERSAVAMIKPGGALTADLEGLAVYKTSANEGFLVATSQGSDNYSVYDRLPPHTYRGTFRIRANPDTGIDGTSQTDGIDVTDVSLPGYPRGLLVAQDGRYDETQNFKYVSWEEIAEGLNLE